MEQTLAPKNTRNYEIDFMKLILAVSVLGNHMRSLISTDNPWYSITNKWGWISVHLFFAISGYFMVCSYMKRKESLQSDNYGKNAFMYLMDKIKSLAFPIYISLAANYVWYILRCIIVYKKFNILLTYFIEAIPEILFVNMAGIDPHDLNPPLWYLSAMFICTPVL
ncbi:MAG: acyltransferase [Oscillospiraceae bacterium]|nr:acyltransferase [Oscillospiraceae bacterium]